MKVILLTNLKNYGKKSDVVNVSDGYAKNYLLPKNLAKEATGQALTERQNEISKNAHEKEIEMQNAQRIFEKINRKTITVIAKAGNNGKLFGAVTSKDISEKINEVYEIDIPKKKIHLENDIKAFGTYKFEIKLISGIVATMSVMVAENV